jgi:hypothetical protein
MSDSKIMSDFLNLDDREFAISGEYIDFSNPDPYERVFGINSSFEKISTPFNAKIDKPNTPVTITSVDFLNACKIIQEERADEYETEGGERSFEKISTAFNAITGKDLTPAEVALIFQILKDVRQWSADRYHHDSVVDCISYASLKAELLFNQYEK